MTVICPQCETRPVVFRGHRVKSCCNPCEAANKAMSRYWAAKGMGLTYVTRSRLMLATIRRPAA